jgi:hypothetical protein
MPDRAGNMRQRRHVLGEAASAVSAAGPQKRRPMRLSEPIPLRTSSTSAPYSSQRIVISFMNEMRAASIALAAYLVSSADSQFMVMKLSSRLMSGSYNRRMMRNASGDSPPTTMRSAPGNPSPRYPRAEIPGLETTCTWRSSAA